MAVVVDIEKTGADWRLPLGGAKVAQLVVDYDVTIRFMLGDVIASIRVGNDIDLRENDREQSFSPDQRLQLGPVLNLVGVEVLSATAHANGDLRVVFVDGRSLSVKSVEDFEAWEFSTSDGNRMVCMPGGELAVWLASSLPIDDRKDWN